MQSELCLGSVTVPQVVHALLEWLYMHCNWPGPVEPAGMQHVLAHPKCVYTVCTGMHTATLVACPGYLLAESVFVWFCVAVDAVMYVYSCCMCVAVTGMFCHPVLTDRLCMTKAMWPWAVSLVFVCC